MQHRAIRLRKVYFHTEIPNCGSQMYFDRIIDSDLSYFIDRQFTVRTIGGAQSDPPAGRKTVGDPEGLFALEDLEGELLERIAPMGCWPLAAQFVLQREQPGRNADCFFF